jgi:dihydrofolate reductase
VQGCTLRWPNWTLLRGNVSDSVAQLRRQPGEDIHVMGSGELIQTLVRLDLIDEYLPMVHPLVLGSDRRLFPDGNSTGSFAPGRKHDQHDRRPYRHLPAGSR